MNKNRSLKKRIVLCCVGGMLLAVCTFAGFRYFEYTNRPAGDNTPFLERLSTDGAAAAPEPSGTPIASQEPAIKPGAGVSEELADMVERVLPSVVGVSASKITEPSELFAPETKESWSVGSGIIVTSDGYILTNAHVAGDMSKEIRVSLSDGKVSLAKCVWQDAGLDLALLKINTSGLSPAVLGDAKMCRVGQTAVAIGNPLGLQFQRTVTRGVISATYRTISTKNEDGETIFMEDLLQTDASINPGSSGGPLLNESGEVVGINTIKVSTAEGIGFAVPINIAKPVIDSFRRTGNFSAAYFGVYAYDRPIADYINQNFEYKTGIYVVSVDQGSPAEKLGIRQGDVITHINRLEVNTMMDFREQIYRLAPDKKVSVTYVSDGKIMEKDVVLGVKK